MQHIPENQIQEYKDLFAIFAKNGKVTFKHLKDKLYKLNKNPTQAEVHEMANKILSH